MEHVVFYPGPEGAAFKRVSTLEEAVRLVEHLRNVEGVADVALYSLTEVPVAFKAYYKVEVSGAEAVEVPAQAEPVEQAAPVAVAEEVAAPAAEASVDPTSAPAEAPAEDASPEPALAGAESNGHREVSGLGFFAS